VTYTHGHSEPVLRSHRWRTAENSCAYLLPHLRADMTPLDVGCGPGSITADLAGRVASVVGVDRSTEAAVGTTPICGRKPRVSHTSHVSAILPPAIGWIIRRVPWEPAVSSPIGRRRRASWS
jgi:Methyltransferase domain